MRRFRFLFVLFTSFSILLAENSSRANVGEMFGFGSQSFGLAGAGSALGQSVSAAYHNPAALAADDSGARFKISYAFMYVQPTFTPISNVVTQNSFIADGLSISNVDMNYKPTVGQELGFSYRLFPDFANITVGLITFLPFNQIAFMDTGEAYVPEYILYRARTQRPQVEMALGAQLGKGFHAGAGAHMAFSLTGNGAVFLNTQSGTASSMRFTSSLTPKLAPYFGLYYAPKDSILSLASVFRMPVASDSNFTFRSSARVFGPLPGVDFNFLAVSALFYDPMALELGGTVQALSWLRLVAQLDYQVWNQFQAPALLITQPQSTAIGTASFPISAGSVPAFKYLNIVVPRAGAEFALSEKSTVRVGYYYRPSMIDGIPTGAGNYLDPAKHALNLGYGLKLPHFLTLENPVQIDFNLTYQLLVGFHVTKTPGNEANDGSAASLADQKIGAPGYDVGGNLFGGGVSLSLAF
jgi:long-chain fatty acid transport protein